MKYYTFRRSTNDFSDILSDKNLKKFIKLQIAWTNHLMIGVTEHPKDSENVIGYLVLKYGDDIVNSLNKDYTPIPNVDYKPDR